MKLSVSPMMHEVPNLPRLFFLSLQSLSAHVWVLVLWIVPIKAEPYLPSDPLILCREDGLLVRPTSCSFAISNDFCKVFRPSLVVCTRLEYGIIGRRPSMDARASVVRFGPLHPTFGVLS